MSRTLHLVAVSAAALVALASLTGCGSDRAAATPSVDPTAAQLQEQLDMLPEVDGAQRTMHALAGTTLTESFTVPDGSPACLQVLAKLHAGGYDVVTGSTQAAVDPATCRTAAGDPGTDTSAGTATILAQGGSEIALTWTATGYTISVTAS